MSDLTAPPNAARRILLKPDPVWLTIVITFVALLLLAPAQAGASATFVMKAALSVAPLFALSIAILAFTAASGADNLIARAFIGRTAPMILFAALMGALSPFCSCGVIPLIAALLNLGVPLPAVMAFWLASPLMDPAQFVLTSSVMGFPFALAKTIAAIAVGLLGGFGTYALTAQGYFATPLRDHIGNGGCGGSRIRNPKDVVWAFWREPARIEKAWRTARQNGLFLGKMLVLAFVLESLMAAWMPSGFIAQWLGGTGPLPILLATLTGIPAYLNGTAALPLMRELMGQGMAPGAAMAFLIGGGVTSIPAAIAVWLIARPPVFAVYLAFAVTGAFLSGLGWQFAQSMM
ncbi:MAG: permease [Methylobacterium sp.]|nr:permease [Methylobacterium sp.]